jgi:membrane protease YdiL (CAAX protease family)
MEKARSAWKKMIEDVRGYLRTPLGSNQAIGLMYLCLITLAEAVTTLIEPHIGMVIHSMVLLVLLIHGSLVRRGTLRRFLILLCLAPLIRMLSLSLPLARFGLPVIYWYMVIGILLFIAGFIAGRITELGGHRIGWTWKDLPLQLLMSLSGFGLGYLEYLILKPGPIAAYITWVDIVVAAFILMVFTGVLEEFIFRGLMQSATMQIMGRSGLVFVAVLFAVLHLGYNSLKDLTFVLVVGLFFGWWVWKTHSLIGASLSHGIANISLYIIFPLALSSGSLPMASADALSTPQPTPVAITTGEALATGTAQAVRPPTDMLVDNEDAGFVFNGVNPWLDFTHGYGGSFRWAYAMLVEPQTVATWIPEVYGCGKYRVEAFIPQGDGLTESAKYTVRHRRGTTEITLNQSLNSGLWAPLGIFEFEYASAANVQLSNQTGEEPKLLRWIGFDAMRWILIGPCEPLKGLPS